MNNKHLRLISWIMKKKMLRKYMSINESTENKRIDSVIDFLNSDINRHWSTVKFKTRVITQNDK